MDFKALGEVEEGKRGGGGGRLGGGGSERGGGGGGEKASKPGTIMATLLYPHDTEIYTPSWRDLVSYLS